MKRIFLYLTLLVSMFQLTKARPVAQERRKIREETYNRPNAGFILYENKKALDKIIENNIIPNFKVISFGFLMDLEEKLDEIRNKKNLEIYYIEIIPFYNECKAFIIYEKNKKEEVEVKKLNWWE